MTMTRSEILQQAEKCVCGQREEDYGNPESNFKIIAELWSAYLTKKANMKIITITPHDVAIMMALLKIGRIASGQVKDDNYIDLAGYASCGGEIATSGK
jgi:hypothetical protein